MWIATICFSAWLVLFLCLLFCLEGKRNFFVLSPFLFAVPSRQPFALCPKGSQRELGTGIKKRTGHWTQPFGCPAHRKSTTLVAPLCSARSLRSAFSGLLFCPLPEGHWDQKAHWALGTGVKRAEPSGTLLCARDTALGLSPGHQQQHKP